MIHAKSITTSLRSFRNTLPWIRVWNTVQVAGPRCPVGVPETWCLYTTT